MKLPAFVDPFEKLRRTHSNVCFANRLLAPLGLKAGMRSLHARVQPDKGELPTPWRLYTKDGKLIDTVVSLDEMMEVVGQRHPKILETWRLWRQYPRALGF